MSVTVEEFQHLKFSSEKGLDFETTLKKRVRAYFKNNGIVKYANTSMKIKTIFMLSLYFTPYLLVMTGLITNAWLIALCWAFIGFGMAGIGMTIIHDANHGSYSKHKTINFILGRLVNVVGAYAPTWKIQHNVLHHTYTNIHDFDEDISPAGGIIRLTKDDKYKKFHRFQFIYAWFLYSLLTLTWVTTKDFFQLFRYRKMGLTTSENFNHLVLELIVSKAIYYFYLIVLPILVLDIPWWSVILLLILKHLVAGFTLAVVFILAHAIPETAFPLPENNVINNNWAIHQLETTSNFGPKSRIFNWFIGGLNYQIEHHLFPNICHVHYKAISKIVKQTAEEYNLPYYCEKTFLSALRSHAKMLRNLGLRTEENLAKA
jgi:linoleoyl-CoA desaturase